jgi:rubrerythrin
MSDTPSYLGLLQGIANAERQGHEYYRAWYEHASDPDLKETVRVVANREMEHSLAFTKRIDELGFELRWAEPLDFSKQIDIVASDCSDYEKAKAVGLLDLKQPVAGKKDLFCSFFDDVTIDVQTGALLGRYIAEERDSIRMLIACAEALEARYGDRAARAAAADGSAGRLESLEEKLDAICAAVGRLEVAVAAKAPTNGKARSKAAV